jgi:hypothetical protein
VKQCLVRNPADLLEVRVFMHLANRHLHRHVGSARAQFWFGLDLLS